MPIAIDDFGTGLSSLTSLRGIPIDGLKIDREFVAGMAEDSVDRAIINMISSLASGLGMRLLAEGVETIEQRDCLLRIGCHHMQGYLFSKPLSEVEMETQLASPHPIWQDHVHGSLDFDG